MAWTSPRTWTVGETLTAANMNTHVRDNENWLANDKPRCSAVRSTAQSITDNVNTLLSMTDADEFDVGAMHDTSTNPSRITVPSGGAGVYLVIGYWAWAVVGGATRRAIGFRKTGVDLTGKGDFRNPDATGNSAGQFSFFIPLVAGDYMEMVVYQNSGGALNVFGGLQLMWMAF